jgi:hypothetical protein
MNKQTTLNTRYETYFGLIFIIPISYILSIGIYFVIVVYALVLDYIYYSSKIPYTSFNIVLPKRIRSKGKE